MIFSFVAPAVLLVENGRPASDTANPFTTPFSTSSTACPDSFEDDAAPSPRRRPETRCIVHDRFAPKSNRMTKNNLNKTMHRARVRNSKTLKSCHSFNHSSKSHIIHNSSSSSLHSSCCNKGYLFQWPFIHTFIEHNCRAASFCCLQHNCGLQLSLQMNTCELIARE